MNDTLWQRLARGVHRVRQRPDWGRFAGPDWVRHVMAAAVTDRFHAKQGRSIGRWVLRADGRRLAVYLKRHHRLPWWRGWLALLWPDAGWSPAWREWQCLEWARAHSRWRSSWKAGDQPAPGHSEASRPRQRGRR